MTTEATPALKTLVDAIASVAHGGGLDATLAALCTQARLVSGATAAVVHLYDGETRALLPSAADGTGPAEAALSLALDDTTDPIAIAVISREARTVTPDEHPVVRALDPSRAGIGAAVVVPLVVIDAMGVTEAHGLLVCGFPDVQRAEGADRLVLAALGDLAAVAIRQARIEHALHERVEWYERVALTDPLTGLANRRTFDRTLELETLRAARQGTALGLAIFTADGVVPGEGVEGAAAADALRRIASALADEVRLVDTVARIAPDRFAVIAPGSIGGAVVRRVRDSVTGKASAGTDLTLTAGVARFPDDAGSAASLLEAAETALAQALELGAGSVVATDDEEASGVSARDVTPGQGAASGR